MTVSPPSRLVVDLRIGLPTVSSIADKGRYKYFVPDSPEVRFCAGDESGLREIYEAHSLMVMGLGRRLVGGDAEDLTQQVFLAAWNSRDRFDPTKGSIGAWLAGITKFKAIDMLRAKNRRPVTSNSELVEKVTSESASGEAEVERITHQMVLERALAELPLERSKVVRLAFYQNLTQQEISDNLGIPLGTVKSHVRRGLLTLRRELDQAR